MMSGTDDTTLRNCIVNILVCYIALREFGLTHHQAVNHLALVFGDDNMNNQLRRKVDGVMFSTVWVETARILGMKLEVILRDRGVFNFLSRWYSYGPCGIAGSSLDLGRQLPKFQL